MQFRSTSAFTIGKICRIVLIISAILIFVKVDVHAKEKKPLTAKDSLAIETWERFSVHAGGFLAGLSSGMTFGSKQYGVNVGIDFEDAFGLSSNKFVFRGGMLYRFGKRRRHKVNFNYFGFFRSSRKVLESDIVIGDEVYPMGTELKSTYNLQIFQTAYYYSFFMVDRFDLGVSLGLYVIPTKLSRSDMSENESKTEFTAPLPVIGFRTAFSITNKFMLKQSAQLLYLKIDEFAGRIVDINFRFEYNPWKHFGFGIGIDALRLKVNADPDDYPAIDFNGSVSMDYTGFLIYAKYSF